MGRHASVIASQALKDGWSMSLCHDIVSLSKINMFLKGNETNIDKVLKQNRKRSNAPVAGITAAGEDAAFCKGREAPAWWLGNSRMKTAPLLSYFTDL